MIIRPMRKEDWLFVAGIYQQGLDSNMASFQTECPLYEAFDASHLSFCRLVMQEKDKIIGWTALSLYSSRSVYRGVAELSIYLVQEARGKGLGFRLLEALIEESEKKGIWTLQAGILSDNSASVRLHEKAGFRLVGKREQIAQDRTGKWRDIFLYERRSETVGIK